MKHIKLFEKFSDYFPTNYDKGWKRLFDISKVTKDELLKFFKENSLDTTQSIPYPELNNIHIGTKNGIQVNIDDWDEETDGLYVFLNTSNLPKDEIMPFDIMYGFQTAKEIYDGDPLRGASETKEKAFKKEWDIEF